MLPSAIESGLAPNRRVRLAGLPLDCLTDREIVALVEGVIDRDERIVLANLNLHGIYAALTTPLMANLLNARGTVVHIDSTPVLWLARMTGSPVPPNARNGHIDLIPKMLARFAERGLPLVIVGANPADAADNERALRAVAPGLKVTAFHGYFDLADRSPGSHQATILAALAQIRPALLLVGMGMPRQEQWIAAIRDKIDVPVIMPVGGFADYFAGRTRTAPRFLAPLGLEWLFRLVFDPRRLAFRYLVEPFLLAGALARATSRGGRWGRDRVDEQSAKRTL